MLLSPRSKSKSAAVTIITTLVAVVSALIINYFHYQYRSVIASEKEGLTIAANYLDMYFNSRLTGLKFLAASNSVKKLDIDKARHELYIASNVLGFRNLVLYDPQGKEIIGLLTTPANSYNRNNVLINDKSFQTALEGRSVVSDIIIEENIADAYVSLRVPVLDDKGNVAAILSARVPTSDIAAGVPRDYIRERGYVFIMDSNGNIVDHPRLVDVYNEHSVFKEQISNMLSDKAGAVVIKSFLDNVDKLFIYTDTVYNNWRVVVAVPVNIVYGRVLVKSLDEGGNILFFILCLALVYGVWRQNRQHEHEREQLRLERMTCVNQLAAGIAHEIRNPLTSIKGFIQLMARRNDRPPRPEHLEIIVAEIGRIDNLISEFQMLARPPKEPVFEKVNMCKLLQDIAFLMEGQLHDKHAELDIKLPTLGCVAFGDVSQLKQVFINLLKNAVEAVPDKGKVVVAIGRQQGMMAITVEDNGNGIPQEIIDKLGTPFFTTKENGTGLGLSVCYSIVQSHGGKISVSSQTSQGTTFTVLLPAAVDDSVLPTVDHQCTFSV
ncbi:PAS domain-containing sensor histidine kinase [Sporomusa malonica]|uniref:histidine kinase n=2 Tax=Sporomusa malonica TaxID=112901 RepID=A0A1W2DUN5_9FIRM|nr:Signal transduction histidine kinase [Sporomusa malonica]